MKPFGYLQVDHRASPGLTEEQARHFGYEPSQVSEGKQMEADVMMCAHCNQPVLRNPNRTRERYYCMQCSGDYICDLCNVARLEPGYVHRSFRQIVDLVAAGEATAVQLGSRPLLVPTRKSEI